MSVFERLHRGVDALRELPGLRELHRAAYARRFRDARSAHLFKGVYATFDEAQRAAPPTAPIGYDDPASAALYLGELEEPRPHAHDYAAFLWLLQGLRDGATSIVDLGGNVGLKFWAMRALVELPPALRWHVVDVPAVVERGRALQRGVAALADPRLEFGASMAALRDADIVFASGTLQYLPVTLATALADAGAAPSRLVVNTTPIHPSRSFFTLNSIGTAFCPYRVQARDAFVGELEASGYALRDHWTNPGKAMRIPFERGCDVDAYSGFCFDRR